MLGARLREGFSILMSLEERGTTRIVGRLDAPKIRSSITLFVRVTFGLA